MRMQKMERKKWKWSLGLVLAVVIGLAMPVGAHAEGTDAAGDVMTSGRLRDNLVWCFDAETKTLTISGQGYLFGDWNREKGVPESPLLTICETLPVEKITFQDCVLQGQLIYLFTGLADSTHPELGSKSHVREIDLSGADTSAVTSMRDMFYMNSDLEKVNVSNLNTGNVTIMQDMFMGCASLESIDVSGFDTSKVTHINNMFAGCKSLKSVDVSKFNTSNVVVMGQMFQDCSSLESVDVSNFDTSKVQHMVHMFLDCSKLESLDVSNFNTENVETMYGMFQGCSKLTTLDVSKFNTSKVTDMRQMFMGCSGLEKLDVSNFHTDNVENMSFMFYRCEALNELDVSNFHTENVTDISEMFFDCKNLKLLDLRGFDMSKVENAREMVSGVQVLWAPNEIEGTFALIDTYTDEDGVEYTSLCKDNAGKKLTKTKVGVTDVILDQFNKNGIFLKRGETLQMTATVVPEDAYDKKLVWSSSDETVATVDENGRVTVRACGNTVIKVKAHNGIWSGCHIDVPQECTSVDELESEHAFENDYRMAWSYTLKGAKNLSVTFDERTALKGWSYIEIYGVENAENAECVRFGNMELAGKTVQVKGDTLKIRMNQYGEYDWGFKVTDVVGEFDEVTYKIVYDLDGGSNHAENPSSGSSNQEVVLKDPTRTGCYAFAGWYTDAECQNRIEVIPAGRTEDITIYAKWEKKEHVYDAGKVTKEATCAVEGEKVYTCTVCGKTKTETIAKTEKHTYDAGQVTKKPTCVADGEKTYTCTVCGSTRTESLPKGDAHSFDAGQVTKEPTCTAEGVKTYTCTLCKAVKTEVLAKAPHDFEGKVTAATLTQDGRITGTCKVCGTTEGETVIYRPEKIALSATSFVYNGKARKPAVKVTDTQGNEIAASNYQVAYGKGCKNVGKYKVTVTFQGNYQGTKDLTFTINPAAVKLKSIAAGSKSLTVKWAKNTKQTTGYELQYSTSKSFAKKATKTVTIKKNTATSQKLTKLKAKKKYYVRIRTYKTVAGKKYYSAWSKAMSGTTKK